MERSRKSFSIRKCWLLLIALLIVPVSAFACKVPVFRYALERWDVDRYTMVVMLNGEPDDEVVRAVKRLTEVSGSDSVNVKTQIMDLATLTPQQQWQLEDFDPTVETPHLQVFYPERNGQRKLCWEGPFTRATLDAWLTSPLRSKIAEELVAGASAVFVLVECEDAKLNDKVDATVRQAAEQAMAEITIPEGVIPRFGANEYLQQHPEASLDDVLRCDVPLKVDFEIARLAFEDRDEVALRAMGRGLAGSSAGPWLIPIFGRGRMLDAIDARNLSVQTVMNACKYMVGECSCTVKTQNPGVDLLMSANWSDTLGGDTVVIVDSQAELSPQFVEIPSGGGSATALSTLPRSDAVEQAGDQMQRSVGHDATDSRADATDATTERATVTEPLVRGWKSASLLVSAFVGSGVLVIWLVVRARNP